MSADAEHPTPQRNGGIFPGPPERCPSCGSSELSAQADGGGAHFRCRRCGALMIVERGRLWTISARAARSAG